MKKANWLTVTIFSVIAILLLFVAGMMFGGWSNRGYGMMGNWGYSPFGWFGMGFGMIIMWLVPTGILALIVYGVVTLTRNPGNNASAASTAPCPNCGKGVQADWKNCPYCGTTL